MNFKRSTAAAALLMASAVPTFAHVPESVVLQVQETGEFYRVPLEQAAEICDVEEAVLEQLVIDADVIYCQLPREIVVENPTLFVEPVTGEFRDAVTDFEDADDDDDDGDQGDDAEETAQDEAIDAANDDDDNLDDALEDDDVEAPADDDDGGDDSDSAEDEDVADEDGDDTN